jgi:hypothetical protein
MKDHWVPWVDRFHVEYDMKNIISESKEAVTLYERYTSTIASKPNIQEHNVRSSPLINDGALTNE